MKWVIEHIKKKKNMIKNIAAIIRQIIIFLNVMSQTETGISRTHHKAYLYPNYGQQYFEKPKKS